MANASISAVGTSKMRRLVTRRRKDAQTVVGTANRSSLARHSWNHGRTVACCGWSPRWEATTTVTLSRITPQRRTSRSRPSSSTSCSDRFELRSTPERGPVPPRNTGTGGRSDREVGRAISRRSTSSINSPSVWPRPRARSRAVASSSSAIDTVVRMMWSIGIIDISTSHHERRGRVGEGQDDHSAASSRVTSSPGGGSTPTSARPAGEHPRTTRRRHLASHTPDRRPASAPRSPAAHRCSPHPPRYARSHRG